jgi:hypothetical protein
VSSATPRLTPSIRLIERRVITPSEGPLGLESVYCQRGVSASVSTSI